MSFVTWSKELKFEEAQPSLKHLAKELKSLKIWKNQESIFKEKERARRE